MSTLLLLTTGPNYPLSYHGYQLAYALKQQQYPFEVFFYQDAVMIANAAVWYPEDRLNLTSCWQQLNISLPVCVSAAMQRGTTDQANSTRHRLIGDTLADGFSLVGLGQLHASIERARHVLQF